MGRVLMRPFAQMQPHQTECRLQTSQAPRGALPPSMPGSQDRLVPQPRRRLRRHFDGRRNVDGHSSGLPRGSVACKISAASKVFAPCGPPIPTATAIANALAGEGVAEAPVRLRRAFASPIFLPARGRQGAAGGHPRRLKFAVVIHGGRDYCLAPYGSRSTHPARECQRASRAGFARRNSPREFEKNFRVLS